MNIFVSSDDPFIAAQSLDDKRLVKMVLETAQIISAVARRYNIEGPWYRLTHAKHPCTLWAGDCAGNLMWLLLHGEGLAKEYTKRFNKAHKSASVINEGRKLLGAVPSGERTTFANCTPYKNMPVVQAYRQCLLDKWQSSLFEPKWTNSHMPSWLREMYRN